MNQQWNVYVLEFLGESELFSGFLHEIDKTILKCDLISTTCL